MGGRLNFRWVSFSVRKFIWKTYFTPRRVFTLQSWQILRASDRIPHAFNTRANVVAVLRAVYEPNLRFICFVIYYRWPALFSLLLFESIRVWLASSSRMKNTIKKKREGMAFKKLGRINPRINPPSAYFNTRFCFYYILLGRNWKSRIYIFLFFPYISSIYIYIIRSRFMNFHSIRRGERKKKRESMRIEQNSG